MASLNARSKRNSADTARTPMVCNLAGAELILFNISINRKIEIFDKKSRRF